MSERDPAAPQTYAEPASEFDELDIGGPVVGIVMGSKSDMPAMEAAEKELTERGIRSEVRVMSAPGRRRGTLRPARDRRAADEPNVGRRRARRAAGDRADAAGGAGGVRRCRQRA
jgi:AIR carboxylase